MKNLKEFLVFCLSTALSLSLLAGLREAADPHSRVRKHPQSLHLPHRRDL